ncbi:MAG: glycosyltransferase family 4 protein [Spirochaetales bacterium]|nr:glycosyltransferase family 4 protein [Spirochaetales bacterium]
MKKKSVCILLPGENISPVGGYKIAYQYANALSSAGYDVSIIHSVFPSDGFPYHPSFPLNFGLWVVDGCQRKLNMFHQKWYSLKKEIKCYNIPVLTKDNIIKADIYIATAICTAHSILTCAPKGKKYYYLIQDFESWDVSKNYVLESFHWPLKKIVIAPWLQEIIRNENEESVLIPNGFDRSIFYLETPIEDRNDNSILFMSSSYERKGTVDILNALDIVNKTHDIKVSSFGACSKRKGAFSDYDYYKRPSKQQLRKLYNDAAIFIGGSREEGYGLPVGEAMCCGATIVCTINGGYQAMVDDSTALQSPIKDSEALAKNIIKLLDDRNLRIQLAKKGYEKIASYSFEQAESKFVQYINENS